MCTKEWQDTIYVHLFREKKERKAIFLLSGWFALSSHKPEWIPSLQTVQVKQMIESLRYTSLFVCDSGHLNEVSFCILTPPSKTVIFNNRFLCRSPCGLLVMTLTFWMGEHECFWAKDDQKPTTTGKSFGLSTRCVPLNYIAYIWLVSWHVWGVREDQDW